MRTNALEIEGFQLSPQQTRVWELQRAGDNAYLAHCAILAKGRVSTDSLKRALERVVNRHEILRTTFQCLVGVDTPLQVIVDSGVRWADDDDWSELSPAEQETQLQTLFRSSPKIDLAEGPIMSARVVKLSAGRQILLLTLPALCADSATLKNLVHEIGREMAPGEYENGEVVLQYADFAAWQNEVSEEQAAEQDDEFGSTPRPNAKLAFEVTSVGNTSFEPDFVTSKISAALTRQIQNRQVQIPTFLMACWQILISRLASEAEVLLGVNFDGRKYDELKSAMGLFAMYLPVQTQVRGNSRFNEFLNNVELASEHSYRNQEYFRSENLSFFDFCFDFEDRAKDFAATDFSLSIYNQYVCADRFKIKLTCIQTAEEIVVETHYDSQLFQRTSIERLTEEFCCLVESATDDPEAFISDLNLLSPVEREQVLVRWNETKAEYPRETCIHELFEQQVERTPEATAVIFRGEELSYRELNARANQLAHYLRERGVSAGEPVGLCVERSVEMVVGMLGVLKAGGGYVPIDPEYPRERVSQMLSDSGTKLLLTQQRLVGQLPEHEAQVVALDGEIGPYPDTNPSQSASAENLAYMIYTSGSTGLPKGVMIPHRALSNHMAWMQGRFPLTTADRVIQKTPFSFDASVWEFYAPLLVGAQLVVAEPGGHADPRYLVQLIKEQKVTILQLVPTLLERLLEEAGVEECKSLRRVFCGGEALSVHVTERFREKLNAEFCNLYGPTEVTIDSVYWTYEEQTGRSSIPIGKPVSNTQAYVFDDGMRPAPIGVTGELYLGGESLAHGYWQRAGLTAERFVPNPYSTTPGARLYRTGDVVRWNEAGELEYFGRNDHQVKIRGYRIETGEIETALLERTEVGRAVVLVREEEGRGKQLAAFVVASNGIEPSSKELREFLQGRVPEYMVPANIAIVPEIPLMPNGKVDRQALLALSKDTNEYEGARNEIEELLVQVWQEVLGVERVGIHDNFFELGGHSLLATQLISRIQILFQIELPIRTLFDAPVIAALGQEIEKILKGGTTTASLPLRPVPRGIELPLSFAQERLWFLDQLAPNNPFYNISAAVRINGPLNEKALERSLSEIIKRHEVLRTTFTFTDERPHQHVHPPQDTALPIIDLSGESQEEQTAQVLRRSKDEARTPFDLGEGPLLRATLLRLAEEESVLLLTMHHVVSDGWSMGILIRELTGLYEAFVKGQPSPLPELAIQYADFAVWQRSWLQGEALFRQMAYWKEQLAGAPPSLDLPTDHPRPEEQTFRGAIETVVFPKTLTQKIKALCQREEVTLYMFLLGAFQVLLSRYTGQNDIAVGSPIANRNRRDTEGLIGFFINTLVMRTDLSGNPSFQEVLKRVREVTLGAYANQDLPFERLVDELKPVRDLSRQPLFQVLFAFQNTPRTKLEVAGLTFSGVAVEKQTVQFDLNVAMAETEQGIACEWHYNTDLFEGATIRRMLANLESLFEAAVTKPEEAIGKLEWLLSDEREQVLTRWNETGAEYPRETCIHELFEQQVERTPEATAVIFGEASLTYEELNRRANQLAHYLRERGVSAGEPVGLCVERSLEMVVGMLGVLKAGGGYVPIDPEYPRERVSQMLGDASVRLLLTQSHLTTNLPSHAAVEVRLDDDWCEIAQSAETNPTASASAENLAYMIYTSGSTGVPKGVMIPHRALGNHMAWLQRRFPLTTADRVIQKTPFSFDASVWEFYAPLLVGAQLVVAEPGGHADPGYLVELIREQKVTILQLVPTMLERLLDEAGVEECRSLRRVYCGGEALSVHVTERFRGKLDAELCNLYGPTEVTIDSTYWVCEAGRSSVPIGKPVSNTQAYVLDEGMRPAPIGVAGELYLGGDSLAHGYWQRAGLTAERFVPNPYSTTRGARLYRTGDVVRWNTAGELEYFGRNDHQVKIRGFRIETGEIETALLERSEVGRAVVLVREEEGKGKQLAAFVVSSNGVEPSSKELRQYLQGRMPEYMVPANIEVMGELPLMPNGKVDRQALLAMSNETPGSEYEAARNNVEELLVQVWQEVLGVERVGIHDNFFELGGDSIVSIQVIARMRQHGVKFKLKEMFQYQTIAELVQVASVTEQAETVVDEAVGAVALTPIQQHFFAQGLANPHHFNQAVMLAMDDCPEESVLETVMQKLVAHHAALRLRFTHTEAGWQQAYAETSEQPLVTMIDLSDLTEDEQRPTLEAEAAEAQASLNISTGPVLRTVLFNCGENGARLLLVVHHLVVDGVSWRILLEDLQTLYGQAQRGENLELPAGTNTFKRWSESLREYANSAEMQQEAEYWLRQSQESIGWLPVDDETGENTVGSVRSVEVKLSREETLALLQDVPKAYHTQIQEALMTALALALRDWTGTDKLLVEMEGHGREDVVAGVDVSRTVGWFTSVYPVLLKLNGDEIPTALKSIKEQLREVPQRGIGYGIWKYLGAGAAERDSAAEVSFNYLGQFDQVLSGGEFRSATESAGPTQSWYNNRPHLLSIGGMIVDGQLQMNWGYSEAVHRHETIKRVAAHFVEKLRALIEHCQSEGVGGHTPSDFPLARLEQEQLEMIETKYPELEDVYSLTPLQQGLIFHTFFAPQSGLYITQTSLRFQQFDKEAFQQAWQQVIDRHEILRTAFVSEGVEEPVQVVLSNVVLNWHEEDWRGLSEFEVEERLAEYMESDRTTDFDFSRAPVMRVALMQITEGEYHFVWSSHHVLLDGWSVPLLIKEIATFYEASCKGEVVELPKPRPYRDYIAWLEQQDEAEAQKFWQQELDGITGPTTLGIDLGALSGVESEIEEHGDQEIRLDEDLTAQLREMGRQEKITLNTIVQGAWALLLSRYSGDSRIVFGTTVAGRPTEIPNVESMVGVFINTVPLCVEVDESADILSWLKQLQQKHLELRNFEHTPLVKIQSWIDVPRGVPLYENLFTFQNYPVDRKLWEDGAPNGLQVEARKTRAKSHYALAVRIVADASMNFSITYDRERFSDASIKRMLGHLHCLLEGIAIDPARQLFELELLSAYEQQSMLDGATSSVADYVLQP